jgi:hypothetical protein
MAVKPRANRKRQMWWCSVLHELQVFIIVTPKGNVQHETVKHIQLFTLESICVEKWLFRAVVEKRSSAGHFNPDASCCSLSETYTFTSPTVRCYPHKQAVKHETNLRIRVATCCTATCVRRHHNMFI